MDIQNQREEFEELPLAKIALKYEFVYYNQETNSYLPNNDYCPDSGAEAMNFAWKSWQQAQKQVIPDGYVLVDKSKTEHWYLDEDKYMWMEEPDNWLCDMDIGEVQAVEHKEYLVTESNTLYATKVWDDENGDVDTWQFFKSQDEAEKASTYCKAKFWEEEVQEQVR